MDKLLQRLSENILNIVKRFLDTPPEQRSTIIIFVALIVIVLILINILVLILKFKKVCINLKIIGFWGDKYKLDDKDHISLLRIRYKIFRNEYYVEGKDFLIKRHVSGQEVVNQEDQDFKKNNNSQVSSFHKQGSWESTVIKLTKKNVLKYMFDAQYEPMQLGTYNGHTVLKFEFNSYDGEFVNRYGNDKLDWSYIKGKKIEIKGIKKLLKDKDDKKSKELLKEIKKTGIKKLYNDNNECYYLLEVVEKWNTVIVPNNSQNRKNKL